MNQSSSSLASESICNFLKALLSEDTHGKLNELQIDRLLRLAKSLPTEAFKGYSIEQSTQYSRNRILLGENCELLFMTWLRGQESVTHDHGCSHCGVLVVQGIATEKTFSHRNGRLEQTREVHHNSGSILIAPEKIIHSLSNINNERLMTLHLYSPPLVCTTHQ